MLDPGYSYFVVTFFNYVQRVLDLILGTLFGITTRFGWSKDRVKSRTDYETSAQLVDVWYRGAFSPAASHTPGNFLLMHNKYIHPKWLLDNDCATLHGVTSEGAWFCVTNTHKDVYDCVKVPFMFMAQYELADQLVLLPMWAFHRLADELGEPSGYPLIGIGMCGRNGSTLLAQMFNKLPGSVVLSEPWTLTSLNELHNLGHFNNDREMERMVKSIMRLQCKPLKERKFNLVAFKLPLFACPMLPTINKVFPPMQMFYSVRHPKACLDSYYKFFQSGHFKLFERFMRNNWWYDNLPYDYNSEQLRNLRLEMKGRETSVVEDLACILAGCLDCLMKFKDKNIFKRIVRYEDLVSNPETELTELFTSLNLPDVPSLVPLAITALNRHSQGAMFDNDATKWGRLSTADYDKADEIMIQQIGLPFGANSTLEQYNRHCNM